MVSDSGFTILCRGDGLMAGRTAAQVFELFLTTLQKMSCLKTLSRFANAFKLCLRTIDRACTGPAHIQTNNDYFSLERCLKLYPLVFMHIAMPFLRLRLADIVVAQVCWQLLCAHLCCSVPNDNMFVCARHSWHANLAVAASFRVRYAFAFCLFFFLSVSNKKLKNLNA